MTDDRRRDWRLEHEARNLTDSLNALGRFGKFGILNFEFGLGRWALGLLRGLLNPDSRPTRKSDFDPAAWPSDRRSGLSPISHSVADRLSHPRFRPGPQLDFQKHVSTQIIRSGLNQWHPLLISSAPQAAPSASAGYPTRIPPLFSSIPAGVISTPESAQKDQTA